MNYLIDFPKFKKKHYLIMIKLLMSVKFSIEKLSDLIVKLIPHFTEFESDKKKEIFIRFLTASLFCITKNRNLSEYKSFINFLSFHLSSIASNFDGGILNEFSYLFSTISKKSFEESFFSDFLKSILSISSAPPLYMISTADQLISENDSKIKITTKKSNNYNNINSNFLSYVNSDSFQTIFEYELPSFTCSVLNVLSRIPPEEDFYQLIQAKFDSFNFKRNFKTTHFVYVFTCKYDFAIPRFEEVFLSNSGDACFNNCIGLASKTNAVIERILNADCCSNEIVNALSEILKKKSIQNFQRAINFFMKFPRVDTWKLVEKTSKANPENLLNILFIGLPNKIDRFLVLYCCLKHYYCLKNDLENKQNIQELVQSVADLFSVQSRFFSLMMIWSNDIKTLNLGFIVAAFESNDFNQIADEYDRICSSK